MNLPTIIQGGMGVAISNWTLAQAVSAQGHLGIISGTGVAQMMISRLMDGDIGGHMRKALNNFPFQETAQGIIDRFYVAKQKFPKRPYWRPPMWQLKPAEILNKLTVAGNFVEVFLAKQGHDNPVGINLLEKVQMPNMASLYGAMLAKVNYVIIGAGIPVQIPAILDKLAQHEPTSYRVDVIGAERGEEHFIDFTPLSVFPEAATKLGDLLRPHFLPIVSSVVLAKSLLKRATGRIDGFVIEAPTAGGHNAPPRGRMKLNELGEPIYGQRDEVDLEKMKALGLPFWLAGGRDTPEQLQEALDAGATGVQIGSAFAFCDESGMQASSKAQVIEQVLDGTLQIRTDPRVSPTGFPFKVAQLDGTMSNKAVYEARPRLCDIGLLRKLYKRPDGKVGYRCSAEPEAQYLKKGGKVEDTLGRGCLCNNLCASAGVPQHRRSGFIEAPIVTAGDGVINIGKFIRSGKNSYSVKDVIDHLTQPTRMAPAMA